MESRGGMVKSINLEVAIAERTNNFDLIRTVAAIMVLYSHCFPLSGATGEPFHAFGMSMGSVAVHIFFVVSGFLVSMSWCRQPRAVYFIAGRTLRVMPGLIVALAISIFFIGAFYTNLPLSDYFSSSTTRSYFSKNIDLFSTPMQWILPGVFEENTRRGVNGSLWTLPFEAKAYLALLIVASGIYLTGKKDPEETLKLAASVTLLVLFGFLLNYIFTKDELLGVHYLRLFSMFSFGVVLFLWRSKVALNVAYPIAIVLVMVTYSASPIMFAVYFLFLPMSVLFLAYVKWPWLQWLKPKHDLSYGIYIYSFPVQQAVAASWPDVGPNTMFFVALPIVLMLSFLSWTLVERPSLSLKRFFSKLR